MKADRSYSISEVAKAPPGPSLQRRSGEDGDDGNLETGESHQRRRRTTKGPALSDPSSNRCGGTEYSNWTVTEKDQRS